MPSLLLQKVEVALGVECGHHYLEVVNIRREGGAILCDFRCRVCGEVHRSSSVVAA